MARDSSAGALIETVDWLGRPLSCGDCPHEVIRAEGCCDLGQICVRDRRTRRIDRFFAANPQEAEKYLAHPYFAARALAAKHANVFLLLPLLDDAEPDVRAMAAYRLPSTRIEGLRRDPDRKVRMVVAQRLTGAALVPLLGDSDYAVRLTAVRRVTADALPMAMDDPDPQVRREVARRIRPDLLPAMATDRDALVRMAVAERLTPVQLGALVTDADLRVRYLVAGRGTARALARWALARLSKDPNPEVRRRARLRLDTLMEKTAENEANGTSP